MKCLRYPEYKTTGFKWLGEVPSHWGVGRTSRYFQIAMGETILQENLEEDGTWPVFSATDGDQYLGKVSNPRVRLFPGDIVIPARGNSIGAVKLVREAATTSQTTIYCKRISPEKFISEYVFFFMRGCRANLFYFTQTAIPQITVGEVGANPILVPPILEQQAIVDFLDQETSKIDALISEQQRLICLLKEKRQAVISHAVTKGVNPDVRMKPSGVEWLGEVPEHWEVLRFKKLISVLTDYTANGSFASLAENVTYRSEGFSRLVRLTDLRENLLNEGLYVDASAHQFLKKSELFGGEVLLANVGAYAGFACMMPQAYGPSTLGPNMYLIHFRDEILSNSYGLECLMSLPVQEQLKVMATSTAQPKLNKDNVRAVVTAIPPSKTEQEEILNYISEQKKKIDALINESHRSIDLLTERRTALISAAVTGKIDVRNYAATQKDAA